MRMLKLAPHAALACLCVAVCVATGAGLRHTLAYLVFVAVYVLAPGLALYFAVWRGRGFSLRAVSVGAALGYSVEPLAFQLTAQAGARPLFVVYPAVVVFLCGIFIWRARRVAPRPPSTQPEKFAVSVALAAASAALLVYFFFTLFLKSPLPGTVSGVTYFVDYPYFIGIAAEALHHWPVTDPRISGAPLSYYLNQFLDMAAAAQVFNIPLPVIALRFYILPILVLLPIQYFELGKSVSHKTSVGLLVVAFGLFFGEADLDLREPTLFGNWGLGYLQVSGSYALGLVILLGLLIILFELAREKPRSPREFAFSLIPITLLLIGLGGTKATALLALAGGLVAALALGVILRQKFRPDLLIITGWCVAVFAILYFFVYRDIGAAVQLTPFGSVMRTPAVSGWQARLAGVPAPIFAVFAALVGLMGFAPAHFAGIFALLAKPKAITQNVLPAGIFAAGLGAFLLLDYPNYAQIVFLYYAMPAAGALAALGLMELWQALRRATPIARAALAAPVCVCVGLAVMDAPFDARLDFSKWRARQPVYTQSSQLTPGMYAAYTWLRQNTGVDDVLAVNNPLVDKTIYILPSPHNFYASAFAERRVFLEGWAYAPESHRLGFKDAQTLKIQPYPERKQLNDRVFVQADPLALATLRDQFGVKYLFIDKLNAPPSPDLSAISQKMYENSDAIIYKVVAQ